MSRFSRAFRTPGALLALLAALTAAPAAAAPARPNGQAAAPTPIPLLGPINVSGHHSTRSARPGDPAINVYMLRLFNSNLLGSERITAIKFEQKASGGNTAQKDASWQPVTLHAAPDVASMPGRSAVATAEARGRLATSDAAYRLTGCQEASF